MSNELKLSQSGKVSAVKSGRAWNGAHRDAGTIVHAVEPLPPTMRGDWFTKAECGAEPGRRGSGWAETSREINCPKCLKKGGENG